MDEGCGGSGTTTPGLCCDGGTVAGCCCGGDVDDDGGTSNEVGFTTCCSCEGRTDTEEAGVAVVAAVDAAAVRFSLTLSKRGT